MADTTTPTSRADPNSFATSMTLSEKWCIDFHALTPHHHSQNITSNDDNIKNNTSRHVEGILLISSPLSKIYADHPAAYDALTNKTKDALSKKGATVALADYAARILSEILPIPNDISTATSSTSSSPARIQTLAQARRHHANQIQSQKKRYSARPKKTRGGVRDSELPYVLERTDCYIVENNGEEGNNDKEKVLQFYLHGEFDVPSEGGDAISSKEILDDILSRTLTSVLQTLSEELTSHKCFAHIATVVLQRRLRSMLQPPRNNHFDNAENSTSTDQNYLDAVAFLADGSLLPRKSGRSILPMASPPAIPFYSPEGSEKLTRVVTVEVGSFWRKFLNDDGSVAIEQQQKDEEINLSKNNANVNDSNDNNKTTVTMRGMIIPRGVTLIVGGGYHGKSTMLQALSYGVYDKLPGDGRERCVTHADAVSIRAEDGRYVNRCNVSAFISNLPGMRKKNKHDTRLTTTGGGGPPDTTRFSTKDASGSTSQAANVIEALESNASALLVDEDVSAANFMARDGRMRAMIMDEPITPLLYRVNGLYLSKEHGVSTVIVVGGVGEWLDVADSVVLMKEYVAYDGLAKARSVSYQFSYGHVQYAGKGVVHRLSWGVMEDKSGGMDAEEVKEEKERGQVTLSPLRRRPEEVCVLERFRDAAIHLMESGSSRLWLYRDDHGRDVLENGESGSGIVDQDDDDGIVDMSKCSQLVGNASEQLYGCGICILWLLRQSQLHPEEDLMELLHRMEVALDKGGMNELIASAEMKPSPEDTNTTLNNWNLSTLLSSHTALDLWETVGYAYRPRRHEVAMALTRMRGMTFEILPEKPREDGKLSKEEEERLEAERRKKALADLWNNRRKK